MSAHLRVSVDMRGVKELNVCHMYKGEIRLSPQFTKQEGAVGGARDNCGALALAAHVHLNRAKRTNMRTH